MSQLISETNINITLCPALQLSDNSYFLSGYCETTIGSLCGIGCLAGYRLVHGDSLRECLDSGTWSGINPKCKAVHCFPLKKNPLVILNCQPKNSTKFGTKCIASCPTKFRIAGPRSRECLINGIWTGYDQYCIVDNQTKTVETTTTKITTEIVVTTMPNYRDYSSYILNVNNNTGIVLHFNYTQFTIKFWIYFENTNNDLMQFKSINEINVFSIGLQKGRLLYSHYDSTTLTDISVVSGRWIHFTWTHSNENISQIYIDGAKQHEFKVSFEFESKLEIWEKVISDQILIASFRDCRKQSGDVFSWSQIKNGILDTTQLSSSFFCTGCSEPASILGGKYVVSDYNIGSSVEYECNFGYEMTGSTRGFCMLSGEWYPVAPTCKHNPCNSECEICNFKRGTCSKMRARINTQFCDPSCTENEICVDGFCQWRDTSPNQCRDDDPYCNPNICNPPCLYGSKCIDGRCESIALPYCPVACRQGQVCVDGRCGCYKGICDRRPCYELCEQGEMCHNWSCSCGKNGKCPDGELCDSDKCLCGLNPSCKPFEYCINGQCLCKTMPCDECNGLCKSNEICLQGKCVCNKQCKKAFCPLPCMNGGKCTGYYECTCPTNWEGYRCSRRKQISTSYL
ncbi:unnamed protein product [Didymodactylos carnosus]|uniref:Uncharacterized protein n=1 Tax=Didymodactylos carnosus TaxID=1234261 RepID=A0A813VKB4_9BILA|nr:unnamed protein product [Didymodactylos carnosus]CAF3629294.1 unnamed protein product [Didymodactylos carnosus]